MLCQSSGTPNLSVSKAESDRAGCPSRASAIWDVALFFFANILAHCLTMRDYPGQSTGDTIGRAVGMITAPVTSGSESISALYRFAQITHRRWKYSTGRLRVRMYSTILGPRSPLELAINARNVFIVVPQQYLAASQRVHWAQPDKIENLTMRTSDTKQVNWECRERLRRVPYLSVPSGNTAVCPIPQSCAVKTVVTLFQLVYSAVILFQVNWSDIRTEGLSSPYVLIIPFLLMSFVNIMANIVIPSYIHIVVLTPLETARDEKRSPGKQFFIYCVDNMLSHTTSSRYFRQT